MSENILFSIVVPVYRAEEYLPECVQSLRSQTYSNVEIILVDDASPDTCPSLCDAYADEDSRIRVIHKPNGGATSARKVGAEIATGAYICCVDSDDKIASDYIEKMAIAAQSNFPDIICCGAFIGENGDYTEKPMKNRFGFYTRDHIEKEIFPELIQTPYATYFAYSYWAKAIKTEIFRSQIRRLDDRIKIGEDGACVIPCVYEARSMYILGECLYYYRDNPSSLTKKRNSFRWDGPKLIAEHLQRQIDLDQYDFRQQWYRKTVHELFTVVKSQFNRDESYFAVARDIHKNLKEPIYRVAIENSRFAGKAGKLSRFSLKYRQLWMIWLFNKLQH